MTRRLAPLALLVCLLTACAPPRDPNYNPAVDPVARQDAWWKNAHAAQKALPARERQRVQMVFLGDSITAGWTTSAPLLWAANFASLDAVNFGVNGDRTEHLLWRIQDGCLDGMRPTLVVLMIGTNNLKGNDRQQPPVQVAEGIAAVLTAIQAKLPDTRILLLGVLPRQPQAYDWIAGSIRDFNGRLDKLADGARVRFLDVGHVFLTPDGLDGTLMAKDQLHPNQDGYRRLAEALLPSIQVMLAGK